MFPQTPIGEGVKRAVITAVITFVYTAFLTYQGLVKACELAAQACGPETDRLRDAVVAGVIVALSPFVIQTAQGAMDQRRADRGEVMASDVPIAIAASKTTKSAAEVAADFAPSKLR